jgi:hypothetical protein
MVLDCMVKPGLTGVQAFTIWVDELTSYLDYHLFATYNILSPILSFTRSK